MKKIKKLYWCICVNSKNTKWLKEGKKYLVRPIGKKINILRDEDNPHRVYRGLINKDRFKLIKSQTN